MNLISHRTQHRNARNEYIAVTRGHRPTSEQYRAVRHQVAERRRYEQMLERVRAGRDRQTLRAQSAEVGAW